MEKVIKLTVRMTEKESQKLTRWAENAGLPKAEYVRQKVFGHEPQSVPEDAFWKRLEELYTIHGMIHHQEVKKKIEQLILEIQTEATQPREVMGDGNHQPMAH